MKPVDPITAATSTALMTGALDRLRAKHAQYRPMTDDEDDANKTGHRPMTIVRDGAPTPPPIPRPAAPVEVEIPDWLRKAPNLPIAEQAWRTQGRIALTRGTKTVEELWASRPPPAASASEPDRGLTATPDAQGSEATEEVSEHFAAAPSSVLSAASAPPTDGDPLADGSAWLQGAGLLAQLQPGAAPLNPSSGAGAALLRALEREGDAVLRRLRHALTDPSEDALRESIAAGDVALGALVPARPSATTRRLDDGAARPVLRVIAGGRR